MSRLASQPARTHFVAAKACATYHDLDSFPFGLRRKGDSGMTSVKQVVRVKAGHRVELVAPELVEGELVDVIVLSRTVVGRAGRSAIEFLDSLPEGPRAVATWDGYDQQLREEKKSWDR
jgi:alpha-D-ribose 1-methylphosphonate 5-triphosphate synthase subunit PhnH